MDTTALFDALNKLVARYPDLTTTTVNDVLRACDYDAARAYDMLCEMVIPEDDTGITVKACQTDGSSPTVTMTTSPLSAPTLVHTHPKKQIPSDLRATVTYAVPHTRSERTLPLSAPVPSLPASPKGAWATTPMARHYHVEQLISKYGWLDRSVAEALFEKNHGCIDLVELDVLEMFPVDEPIAFALITGDRTAKTSDNPRTTPYRNANQKVLKQSRGQRPARSSDATVRREMEDKMRQRAEDDIRRVAQGMQGESVKSPSIIRLRQQLWDARLSAMQANALASQTRKSNRISDARKKTDEMHRLSTYLLERIRHSEEYRNGCVDLHGLTKDEAIQLVEWKLIDNNNARRRFRVITGKGNHSQNGQAVLRPALERYLRSRGITFTPSGDGILSVTP